MSSLLHVHLFKIGHLYIFGLMKRAYLLAYNFLLFVGWTLFFFSQVAVGFQMNASSLMLLNIFQLAAILEIGHAALGWVRSPVSTAFIQVFSRVFVLYWINVIPFGDQIDLLGISGLQLITIAWGITEMIRYSFYFFSLLNIELKWLTFLRYTLFIVLYPLGVSGEFLILFSQFKLTGFELSFINALLGIVMLSYFYFFPQLYGYMFKQRRKRLG